MNKKNRAKHMKFRKESTYEEPNIREVKLILLGVLIVWSMWFYVIPFMTEQAQPLRFLDGWELIPSAYGQQSQENLTDSTFWVAADRDYVRWDVASGDGSGTFCPTANTLFNITNTGPTISSHNAWEYLDLLDTRGCTFSIWTIDNSTTSRPILPFFFNPFITDFGISIDLEEPNADDSGQLEPDNLSEVGIDGRINFTAAYEIITGRDMIGDDAGDGEMKFVRSAFTNTDHPERLVDAFKGGIREEYLSSMATNNTYFQIGAGNEDSRQRPGSPSDIGLDFSVGGTPTQSGVIFDYRIDFPSNSTSLWWQMQEHPKFVGTSVIEGFFGIDDTTFTMDTGSTNPEVGQVVLFRSFDMSDFFEDDIRITGGYQADGGTSDLFMRFEIKDGKYGTANQYSFPTNEHDAYREGGSLGVIHVAPSSTGTVIPFDVSLKPNWSNRTSDFVTLFIGIDDNSTAGRMTANVTSVELDSDIKYDFTDIFDFIFYETSGSLNGGGDTLSNFVSRTLENDYSQGLVEMNTIATSGVTAPVLPTPTAPTALTATPFGNDAIKLTWNHNLINVTDFRIERDGSVVNFTNNIEGEWIDHNGSLGLESSTLYSYEVCAVNGETVESTCATDSATTTSKSDIWFVKEYDERDTTTITSGNTPLGTGGALARVDTIGGGDDWLSLDSGVNLTRPFNVDIEHFSTPRAGEVMVLFKSFNITDLGLVGSDFEVFWDHNEDSGTADDSVIFRFCTNEVTIWNTTNFPDNGLGVLCDDIKKENIVGPTGAGSAVEPINSRFSFNWDEITAVSDTITAMISVFDVETSASYSMDIANITWTNVTTYDFQGASIDIDRVDLDVRASPEVVFYPQCDMNVYAGKQLEFCDFGVITSTTSPDVELKQNETSDDWQYREHKDDEAVGDVPFMSVDLDTTGFQMISGNAPTNDEPREEGELYLFKSFPTAQVTNVTIGWVGASTAGLGTTAYVLNGTIDRWSETDWKFGDDFIAGQEIVQTLITKVGTFAETKDTIVASLTNPDTTVTVLIQMDDDLFSQTGTLTIKNVTVGTEDFVFDETATLKEEVSDTHGGDRGLLQAAPVPLGRIDDLTATPITSSIFLNWTDPGGSIAGYRIERTLGIDGQIGNGDKDLFRLGQSVFRDVTVQTLDFFDVVVWGQNMTLPHDIRLTEINGIIDFGGGSCVTTLSGDFFGVIVNSTDGTFIQNSTNTLGLDLCATDTSLQSKNFFFDPPVDLSEGDSVVMGFIKTGKHTGTSPDFWPVFHVGGVFGEANIVSNSPGTFVFDLNMTDGWNPSQLGASDMSVSINYLGHEFLANVTAPTTNFTDTSCPEGISCHYLAIPFDSFDVLGDISNRANATETITDFSVDIWNSTSSVWQYREFDQSSGFVPGANFSTTADGVFLGTGFACDPPGTKCPWASPFITDQGGVYIGQSMFFKTFKKDELNGSQLDFDFVCGRVGGGTQTGCNVRIIDGHLHRDDSVTFPDGNQVVTDSAIQDAKILIPHGNGTLYSAFINDPFNADDSGIFTRILNDTTVNWQDSTEDLVTLMFVKADSHSNSIQKLEINSIQINTIGNWTFNNVQIINTTGVANAVSVPPGGDRASSMAGWNSTAGITDGGTANPHGTGIQDSGLYNATLAGFTVFELPPAPTGVNATATNSTVLVEWNQSVVIPNVTQYHIQRGVLGFSDNFDNYTVGEDITEGFGWKTQFDGTTPGQQQPACIDPDVSLANLKPLNPSPSATLTGTPRPQGISPPGNSIDGCMDLNATSTGQLHINHTSTGGTDIKQVTQLGIPKNVDEVQVNLRTNNAFGGGAEDFVGGHSFVVIEYNWFNGTQKSVAVQTGRSAGNCVGTGIWSTNGQTYCSSSRVLTNQVVIYIRDNIIDNSASGTVELHEEVVGASQFGLANIISKNVTTLFTQNFGTIDDYEDVKDWDLYIGGSAFTTQVNGCPNGAPEPECRTDAYVGFDMTVTDVILSSGGVSQPQHVDAFEVIATVDSTTFSFNDTSVEKGIGYTYQIIAENLVGNSTDNNQADVVTNDIPSKPSNIDGQRSFGDIDIDWELAFDSGIGFPSTGLNLTSIQIFRSENGGAFSLASENFPNPINPDNFHNDISLTISSLFDYRVRGCNLLGCGSNATIQFAPPPPAPQNVVATAVLEDVLVEWTGNPTTDSDYRIERRNAEISEWQLIEIPDAQPIRGPTGHTNGYIVLFDTYNPNFCNATSPPFACNGSDQVGVSAYMNMSRTTNGGFVNPVSPFESEVTQTGPNPIGLNLATAFATDENGNFFNEITRPFVTATRTGLFQLIGANYTSTGDNLLLALAGKQDSRGTMFMFKTFDKADLPNTGNYNVTWAAWRDDFTGTFKNHPPQIYNVNTVYSDSTFDQLTIFIADGSYDRLNSTDFPNLLDTALTLKGGDLSGNTLLGGEYGIFGASDNNGAFLHTNSTSYDLTNSTEDQVTVFVKVSTTGRNGLLPNNVMEIQDFEIENFGKWTFQRGSGTNATGHSGDDLWDSGYTGSGVAGTGAVVDFFSTGRITEFQDNGTVSAPFEALGSPADFETIGLISNSSAWFLKEHSPFGPFSTTPGDIGFEIGPNNTLFINGGDTQGYGGAIGSRRGDGFVYKSFAKEDLIGKDLIFELQQACQVFNACTGVIERARVLVLDGDYENTTNRDIAFDQDNALNFGGVGIGIIEQLLSPFGVTFPPQPIFNLTVSNVDYTGSSDRITIAVDHQDNTSTWSGGTEVFRIFIGNDTDIEQQVFSFEGPVITGNPTINTSPSGCAPSCPGGQDQNEDGFVYGSAFPEEFFLDEDVEKGVVLEYQVIAINGTIDSLPGNATVLTNDFPGQVEGLTSDYQNPNDILVDWSTVAFDGDGNPTTGMNIINYNIYFKNVTASETEFSFLNSTNATTTEFLHETDTFPDLILYTVSACNEFGCGANSTESSSEFLEPPNNVTNVIALAVNNTVALDWDNADFAINYTLLRAETDASDLLFSDDFSTDNFSDIGTDVFVDTSLEQLNATADSDGTYHSTLLDLVGIANPNNWSLRYMIDIDSITARTSDLTRLYIGLFDSTADDDTVQDSISVLYDLDSGTGSFINPVLRQTTGATLEAGSGDSNFAVDLIATDTIYTEIKRTSGTSVEISFFTDNGFTNLIEKETLSITSGLDNLQYIGVKTADRTDATGIIQAIVDDLEFFNGTATGSFSIIAEGIPISEVSDDTVLTSTNYTYAVYGVNDNGNGTTGFSNSVVTNDLPTAPLNLTGAMGIVIPDLEDVFLDWEHPLDNGTGSPSTGVDIIHYQIERKAGVGLFAFLANTSDANPMYEDETVVSAANYTYQVRGVNALGFSPFSNTFSIITTPLMPPEAPTNLTATTISGSEIQLDWLAAVSGDDPTEYVLQQRHVGFGGFVTIATIPAPTLFKLDSGLVSGDEYDYQVRADNGAGSSPYSNIATNTTFSVPSAPQALTAVTLNQTAIFVDWLEPTITNGDIQNYTLDIESPISGGFSFLSFINGNETNFTATSLTPRTEYNFRVNATNLIGSGPYSNEAANTTFGVPSEPVNLGFDTNGISEITVDWDQPLNDFGSPVTGYRIDQAQGVGGTFFTVIADTGNNIEPLEELFVGLLQQTTYIYRIAGFNSFGLGDFSGNLTAGTFLGPSPPENFFAVFNATKPYSVNLSWETPLSDGGKPIQGFLVERKDLSGVFQLIANLTSPLLLNYTDQNLIQLSEHEYRVAAYTNPVGSFTPGQPVATVVAPNFLNFEILDFQVVGDVLSQQYSITIDDCFPACTLTQADIIRNGITESNFAVGEPISLDTELNFTSHFILVESGTQFINTSAIVTNLGSQGANETGVVTTSLQFVVDTIFFNHSRTTDFTELNFELTRHPIPWNSFCELRGGQPSFLGQIIELPFGGQIILPQSVLVDPFGVTATIDLQGVGTFSTPPTFDVVPARNAYMSCDDPEGIQILAFTSFGTGNGTLALTGFTDQLGTFLGVPVPFIFIIILAAIWTGRSASTGIIFLTVAIGALGVLGYFDPLSGQPTSGDPLGYFWAFIVILTLLGVFLGKRFF